MKKNCLIVLGLLAACNMAAWSQTFSGGNGTAASPYQIKTVADVAELATQVNGGTTFDSLYLELASDITYASTDAFTPIGTSKNAFMGTLDGKNHVIKNLVVSGASYQGFFGYIGANGTVKNITFDTPSLTATNSYGGVVTARLNGGKVDSITVKNATFTNTNGGFKGGLVGFAAAGSTVEHSSFSGDVTTATSWGCIVGQNYGKIHYCWSDATVIGSSSASSAIHLGGIAGVMLQLSGEAPEITDCYFLGTIQGASQNDVGGLVGSLRKATMERCWNGGYLQSTGYCGGLVGNFSSGTIQDCYNVGTIYDQSSESVGGLVGYQDANNTDAGGSTIENCLSVGSIFNAVLSRHEGCELVGQNISQITVKNTYFDIQVASWGSENYGKTTTELTSGTALQGYSTDVWLFADGMYPRLKNTASLDVSVLNATPFYLSNGETHSKVMSDFTVSTANDVEWQITGTTQAKLSGGNVAVTRGSQASDAVLHAYLGDYEKRCLVTIYPVIFSGTGTEADPYLITSYDDLKKLSDATNNQNLDFRGEYFKVTADIDMQADTSYVPVSAKSNFAFNGTFDGQNHAFKNWKFDNVAAATLNKGLFGFLAQNGTIKNVTIDKSCQINAYRNFATVVAYSYGTIDGCKNYATVHTSAGYSAGIAYVVEEGTVKNCLNAGDVVSEANAGCLGGIAYALYSGTVTNCQNSGRIVANFTKGVTLGGILGYNRGGNVSDVLNTGSIEGYEKVGGIVGEAYSNSSITNALTVAPVIFSGSSDAAGGAVGSNNSSASYANVVYDSQIAIYKNFEADGLAGKLTSEITGADFGGEAWTHTAGCYPILTSFATEPVSVLGSLPVTFAAADTRTQISADAQLANATGLTWTLTKGEKFSVSGDTLKYAGSDSFVEDELTAAYQGLTKTIPISATGNILPGSGTADDPWIIATPSDLVKVSTTVASTGNSFDGKTFSVVNDLDMKDTDIEPIASGNNKFQAALKGNGHSISNLNITSTAANTGLIGNLGMNGSVTSLTIASGTISGAGYVGAIAGTSDGTISDVKNYATVSGTSYVGGIVGKAETNGTVNNACNYGSVTNSGSYTGGIAGYADGQNALWTGLYNGADINGVGRVAGIIGQANATNLRDVTNCGTITATSNYAGGIVAYYQTSDSIVLAKNDGDVSGKGYVGGIVGQAYKSYTYSSEVRIADSYNYGSVTSSSDVAGGIVAAGTAPVIERCANVGNVTNTKATVGSSSAGAGGIAGKAIPKITDCSNSGTISADNGVGQILGVPSSTYTNFAVTNVVCTGTVTGYGTGANVGALVGKTSSHATFSGVAYDKQMCNLAAMAGAEAAGATAALTTQIEAPGDAWTVTEDGYPCIKSLASCTPVFLSSLAVKLDTGETRYGVTQHFMVTAANGCNWTGDEHFYISAPYVNLASGSVGDYDITVSSGDYKHTVTLTVNAPDGSTSVSEIDGDVPVVGHSYYDIAGRQLAEPSGVCIEVLRYQDGTTVSRKVLK